MATQTAAAANLSVPVQMHTEIYNTFVQHSFIYQTWLEIDVLILFAIIIIFKPYLPFLMSKIITHRPVVGVMTRVRNIVPLGGFMLRNGMYRKDWKDTTMYYVKKYVGSFFIAGVPYDTVHIDQAHVQDPIMNRFIYKLREMGYHEIRDIKEAIKFSLLTKEDAEKEFPDPEDPNIILMDSIIHRLGYSSYEEAKRDKNPSNLTAESEIYAPKFSNIPQDILLSYGYRIAPGSVNAQILDTIDFNQPPIPEDKFRDMAPYFFLIICIAIGMAIVLTQVK